MKIRLFTLLMSLPIIYSTPALAAKYEIRWRINHTPTAYFHQAVEVFKNALENKTNGEVTVVADAAAPETTKSSLLLKQVQSGEIEMAQVYTSDIATNVPAYHVFDLPYLIQDHTHASQVFENEVGKKLLSQLDGSKVVGLGFTYSGGFVVRIGKNKAIEKVEDFEGSTIKALGGQFSNLSLEKLGAKVVTTNDPKITTATYADLTNFFDFTKMESDDYIFNETGDRLLVTTLVINKHFFNSLPTPYKKAVREAAFIASRAERENIVKAGNKIRNTVKKRNFKIKELSKHEKLRWKKRTTNVYSQFFQLYPEGEQLVKSIQKENNLQVADR